MPEGLYAAGAGMEAAQVQLDAVANDIANADTPGYQSERIGFQDLLYNTENAAPSTAIVGAGAQAGLIGFSQAQGPLQQTGEPLDVGLSGPGYLEVRQPDGSIGLTRNGVLELNARGQIVTASGDELVPPLTLPKGSSADQIQIASDGTVSVAGKRVGKITVVNVPAPDKLLAQAGGVFSITSASGAATPAKGTQIQQGYLQQSNVDMVTAMATMESAEQSYDMGSKTIEIEAQMGQIAATLRG
ncbi:MAG: flagellar hook-basal body protein [Solirubrobacteraceae bacterium]